MKQIFPFLVFSIWCSFASYATHNRAGEITYRHISGFTYEATITTYTKKSSPADRDSLSLRWGDGYATTLLRQNGPDAFPVNGIPDGENIPGKDIKVNIYKGVHTYPGPSQYVLSFEDPNRNSDVKNIPNSVNVPFYVETILVINPFLGLTNTSPILKQPPIDDGCVGKIFIHNPGAVDLDTLFNDSLAYELTVCKAFGGNPIFGYSLPPGITIDPITGDFIWNTPQAPGEYNFAILIKEYRSGYLIGLITRDMQITIRECNQYPPVLSVMDTCIEEGTFLKLPVSAYDPDGTTYSVTLTATGLPFLLSNSPAQFPQPLSAAGSVSGTFTWQTNCSHVRKQSYQVVFKAEDDGKDLQGKELSLVDMKTARITVIAPAPENPSAAPAGDRIIVKWDPSVCSNTSCYKIYRRAGSIAFTPGYCETGLPGYLGYTLVGTTGGWLSTTFIDDDNGNGLVNGINYCYRIVACYPDEAESYASTEICAQLKKDIPVITNVSVETTDAANGKINIAWSKPTELDTNLKAPFRYLIYRSTGFPNAGTLQLIDSTGMTDNLNDTTYADAKGLNTVDNPYTYRIDLYADSGMGRIYIGKSQKASSVYLSIAPSDNRNILSWKEVVPWVNTSYVIYRQNKTIPSQWDSIAMTYSPSHADTGLANDTLYCYYVKSAGSYSASGFIDPIYNNSQQKCGASKDNILPCPPQLTVIPDCIQKNNSLLWTNPNDGCSDDVLKYNIYYRPLINGNMELLTAVNPASNITYLHDKLSSIAGCYLITSLDSVGNESTGGTPVCVDNCPVYTLPNIYTPNSDGINDLFIPFPYRYIKDVDIKIYNRWGQIIFTASDPDVKWNGKNTDSGKDCPEGVYYYVCDVNEIRLDGIRTVTITGFVHLLRNK